MTEQTVKMTRQDIQDEALIIHSLLAAAQAMFGEGNEQDMLTMVEMAAQRANKLNIAMDSVNE